MHTPENDQPFVIADGEKTQKGLDLINMIQNQDGFSDEESQELLQHIYQQLSSE